MPEPPPTDDKAFFSCAPVRAMPDRLSCTRKAARSGAASGGGYDCLVVRRGGYSMSQVIVTSIVMPPTPSGVASSSMLLFSGISRAPSWVASMTASR